MSSKKQPLFGIIALFFCVCYTTACAQLNQDRLRYIEKYKDIAISEMERAGVPASIKLAQAILESNSGKSTLANKANNHFGMKCGYGWEGKTFYREDDDYDAQGNLIKSCFRVFKDPDASFVAHSEFLRDPRKNGRYGFLFRLDPLDYKRWALGLKKAGYATNPRYPDLLIKIIEEYELHTYDNMDTSILADAGELPDIVQPNVVAINGASVALAQVGESVQDISVRTSIPVDRILKYNERLSSPSKELEEDYKVYLQPKRWSYRGKRKDHYVQSGETMFSISQKYGVKLKNLYSKNRLEYGREPAVGEKIRIRGFRVSKKDAPRIKRKGEKDNKPVTIPIRDNDKDPEIIEFDSEVPETDIDDFDGPNSDRPDISNNGDDNSDIILDDPDDRPVFNNNNDGEIPQTNVPDDPDVSNPDDGLPGGYYIVEEGDTLYRIARKYNMSVPDLKRINNITSNTIQIGQRLNLQ